jgi:hypothetical protein
MNDVRKFLPDDESREANASMIAHLFSLVDICEPRDGKNGMTK